MPCNENNITENGNKNTDGEDAQEAEISVQMNKLQMDDQQSKSQNLKAGDDANSAVNSLTNDNNREIDTTSVSLQEIIDGIQSTDRKRQLEASKQCVILCLPGTNKAPIDDILEVIPQLISFLKVKDQPELRFQAISVITYVTYSATYQQTCALRKALDASQNLPLLHLLSSPDSRIINHTVLTLLNVASKSLDLRNYVIQCGVVPTLLHLIQPTTQLDILQAVMLTMSQLCRSKLFPPPWFVMEWYLPKLTILLQYQDEVILHSASLALSYITCHVEMIDEVIGAKLLHLVINLFRNGRIGITRKSVHVITNMSSHSERPVDILLSLGVMGPLCHLLTMGNDDVTHSTLQAISNLLRYSSTLNATVHTSMQKHGGIGSISHLQNHADERIKRLADDIIEVHLYYNTSLNFKKQ